MPLQDKSQATKILGRRANLGPSSACTPCLPLAEVRHKSTRECLVKLPGSQGWLAPEKHPKFPLSLGGGHPGWQREASGGAWSPFQLASYKVSAYPPASRPNPGPQTQSSVSRRCLHLLQMESSSHIEVHAFNMKEISGAGEAACQLKVLVGSGKDVTVYSRL